jgi:hypothetical protein
VNKVGASGPTYWVLIHKPSGGHMPELSRKKRGGYTSTEPSRHPHPPRLFSSESAAKMALTWWLKGISWVDDKPDYYGEVDGGMYLSKPKVPRVRDEWIIVPVQVIMQMTITQFSEMIRR